MLKKGERGDGMDKLAVLRQYFGFPAFRAGQQTLIDAVLSGRDALGVMPTGGGKSLCYELPALLLPGMTLDHGGRGSVGKLFFIVIVNEEPVKIRADLRRFGLDGCLLAACKLHGHDSRAKDRDGKCQHKNQTFLPFFQNGHQPFYGNLRRIRKHVPVST